MGGPNKLLMCYRGRQLISLAVNSVGKANFSNFVMVTGRDHVEVQTQASGFEIIHNPNFENGFGTSLAAGFSALLSQTDIEGALVMLADMPLLTSNHLNQLIEAFDEHSGAAIIRAAFGDQPGNPVIIPRVLFADMVKLTGGQSGQAIIKASGLQVHFVDIGYAAVADIDTPEALSAIEEIYQ